VFSRTRSITLCTKRLYLYLNYQNHGFGFNITHSAETKRCPESSCPESSWPKCSRVRPSVQSYSVGLSCPAFGKRGFLLPIFPGGRSRGQKRVAVTPRCTIFRLGDIQATPKWVLFPDPRSFDSTYIDHTFAPGSIRSRPSTWSNSPHFCTSPSFLCFSFFPFHRDDKERTRSNFNPARRGRE